MNLFTQFISELQAITLLFWRAVKGLRKRPRYLAEMIVQMDQIGVGTFRLALVGFKLGEDLLDLVDGGQPAAATGRGAATR